MKRYWIIVSAGMSILFGLASVSGCFSALSGLSGINNGGPSAGSKVGAAALDVVTLPVQLPLWLLVGIGAGIDNINHSVEDRSWEAKRNALHAQFVKDPVKMQNSISPEFQFKGLALGKVYADESIPLSEEFLVKNVMQYFSYVRCMGPIRGDDEFAALLHRKEWTENGLRAIAPQIYLGRRHYPAPDYVTLAYLSNPKTPRDVIDVFAKHPSFKYRKYDGYCKTMLNEINTNIIAHLEKPLPHIVEVNEEEPDTPEYHFLLFLRNWTGQYFEGEADWRVGGGMWDLCAVGTPVEPCNLMICDAKAKIVELYGDRKSGGWDGTSRYIGGIGAVVLEFESVTLRDSFLKAIMPVCRLCGPECWSQLVFAPMDGSGECYGICLEREKESDESPSRIFVVNLQCPSPIRFWAPTKYHHQHLWFADGTMN